MVKEEFEFNSRLNSNLSAAWIKATKDPECHVVEWARRGVPLGHERQHATCGIFPELDEEDNLWGEAPPLDLLQGTRNYAGFYDLSEAAEEELSRYVQKGFAVIRDRHWLFEHFGTGTVSKMRPLDASRAVSYI